MNQTNSTKVENKMHKDLAVILPISILILISCLIAYLLCRQLYIRWRKIKHPFTLIANPATNLPESDVKEIASSLGIIKISGGLGSRSSPKTDETIESSAVGQPLMKTTPIISKSVISQTSDWPVKLQPIQQHIKTETDDDMMATIKTCTDDTPATTVNHESQKTKQLILTNNNNNNNNNNQADQIQIYLSKGDAYNVILQRVYK